MSSFGKLVRPYIVFMSIFIIMPMLLILLYAFTKPGNDVTTINFTLDNFLKFLDPVFIKVLTKSLQIALITTLLCILIGYPVAYIIANLNTKLGVLMVLLITFPMWINMLIRTYAWIGITSDAGIINEFLQYLGWKPVEMLYTDFAVIMGMVYNSLPFMILQIHSSLDKMDKAVINASYDLGANRYQTFTRITLPLSLPGVIAGITLVFLPSVSTFVIPKLLGGGQYMLIGNLIEKQFITVGDWNFGSAISLIMALVIMASMYLTKKADKNIEEEKGKGVKLW